MKKIIKTKLTKTKKNSLERIYLIGKEFFNTKFNKKKKISYDIDFDSKRITISANSSLYGMQASVCSKKVKGKDIPLLDISNKDIQKVFYGINKCKVDIYEDQIIVTPAIEGTTDASSDLKASLINLKNILAKRRSCKMFRMPINKLDILLKKASGDSSLDYQQLSIFDVGFEMQHQSSSISSCISESINNVEVIDKTAKTLSLLAGYKYFETFAGSGIGGMAFDEFGAKSVGYSEVDKFAIMNYEANFPGRKNLGDISKINYADVEDFQFLIGGSPCPDFCYTINNRKAQGLKGENGNLFFEYYRALTEKKPNWFIYENVNDLTKKMNEKNFNTMLDLLSKEYNIKWQVMNTSDYGIPQTRRRVYIVGQRKDLNDAFDFSFPTPIKLDSTLQDLLESSVDDKYYLSEKFSKTVLSSGTGGWYAKAETDLKIARPLSSTMGKCHRASQDSYVHTSYQPIDKTNLRRLTPRECARLQGLDDSYKIVVSDTQAYKIFGNAMSLNVVKSLVKKLALYIKRTFGINQNLNFNY